MKEEDRDPMDFWESTGEKCLGFLYRCFFLNTIEKKGLYT